MNEQELQAIEERANKATSGPWDNDIDCDAGYVQVVGSVSADIDLAWCGDNEADAVFIAHARADVPALIAEIRSLRAKLDAVPVDAFRYMVDPWRSGPTTDAGAAAWAQIDAWMQAQERA